jgi:hypothetical protein
VRIGRFVVLGIVALALVVGCGGGRDVRVQIRASEEATEPVAVEPTQASGSTAVAAAPTATAVPATPTGQVEPTASSVDTPAAIPETTATSAPIDTPTTSAPTDTPLPLPTEAPQPPAADTYTFDPATLEEGFTALGSFRQKVDLQFTADETGVHSRAVYDGEVTTNPAALHSTLRIEGQAAAQLPSNQVEVIWIGDQAWVKVGRKPWVRLSVTAMESQYAGQVVSVGDLLPFVQQALRAMPDETVNGIPCRHYAYDLQNLQSEAGLTSAQGDIWVAKDGGYVVRLTLAGHGTYYDTYTSSGTLNLVYDLYDVNAPITIEPPR